MFVCQGQKNQGWEVIVIDKNNNNKKVIVINNTNKKATVIVISNNNKKNNITNSGHFFKKFQGKSPRPMMRDDSKNIVHWSGVENLKNRVDLEYFLEKKSSLLLICY